MRGAPAPVNRPKFVLVNPVTGLLKLVRLNTLNASRRNSPVPASPRNGNRNTFTSEASTLEEPGPKTTFRPNVPTVPRPVVTNPVLPDNASILSALLRPAP